MQLSKHTLDLWDYRYGIHFITQHDFENNIIMLSRYFITTWRLEVTNMLDDR